MKRCTLDHTVSQTGTRWRPDVGALATHVQRQWLSRPGALTAGLRKLGKLDLVVLHETPTLSTTDESRALGVAPSTLLWRREIAMQIEGVMIIVARSLTPITASRGVWRGIRQLGSRPLADILYRDHRVSRLAFEFARCHRHDRLAKIAQEVTDGVTSQTQSLAQTTSRQSESRLHRHLFWARRSVFVRAKQHLLVSECFLPSFWALVLSRQAPKGNISP